MNLPMISTHGKLQALLNSSMQSRYLKGLALAVCAIFGVSACVWRLGFQPSKWTTDANSAVFALTAPQLVEDLAFAGETAPVSCPPAFASLDEAAANVCTSPPSGYDDLLLLDYIRNDNSNKTAFNGNQTLLERHKSFRAQPRMLLHCGFINQPRSGMIISKPDRTAMNACQTYVTVTSVFGAFDVLKQPSIDALSNPQCWFVLTDQITLAYWKTTLEVAEDPVNGVLRVGVWHVVLIDNLPYPEDLGLVSNLVKLLVHRLFPTARYSVYIDGKVTLRIDPAVLIDAMLLQHRRPYAIAAHPARQNAWDEGEASKEHKAQYSEMIDKQVLFYEQEGFPLDYQQYDSRQGGLIGIATDVPESNTIIREHNSLTNLFSCIWFNEVVRFSQREQVSFGYVKKRMSLRLPMYIWPDCREVFLLTHDHVSK